MYVQFECIIKELGKKHKYIVQQILIFFLQNFGKTNKMSIQPKKKYIFRECKIQVSMYSYSD
jgi:hypothetical protein